MRTQTGRSAASMSASPTASPTVARSSSHPRQLAPHATGCPDRTTSSRPAPPPPRTSEAPRPPGSVDLLRPPISGRWGIRVSERPDGRSVGIPTLPPGRGGPEKTLADPPNSAHSQCPRQSADGGGRGGPHSHTAGPLGQRGHEAIALPPRRSPSWPSPPREEGWLRTPCGRRRGGARRQCPPRQQRHRRSPARRRTQGNSHRTQQVALTGQQARAPPHLLPEPRRHPAPRGGEGQEKTLCGRRRYGCGGVLGSCSPGPRDANSWIIPGMGLGVPTCIGGPGVH